MSTSIILTILIIFYAILIKNHNRGWAGIFLPSTLFLFMDLVLQTAFPIIFSDKPEHETLPALELSFAGYLFFFITYFTLNLHLKENTHRNSISSTIESESYNKSIYTLATIGQYIGSIIIILVFSAEGVIPALSDEPNNARLFFGSERYFTLLKFPYWGGIQLVTICTLIQFIFKKSSHIGIWINLTLACVILFLTTHRAPLLGLILGIVVYHYQTNPEKFNLLIGVIYGLTFTSAVFIGLYLRDGSGDMLPYIMHAISSGSSFVDILELGDAIKLWDGDYLWGSTYLGSLISLIPGAADTSFLRWKDWTKVLFGQDPEAGGMRLTSFGEPYFNFGLAGVWAKGIFMATIFYYWDMHIKAMHSNTSTFKQRYIYLLYMPIGTLAINFYEIRFFFFQLIALLIILISVKISIHLKAPEQNSTTQATH